MISLDDDIFPEPQEEMKKIQETRVKAQNEVSGVLSIEQPGLPEAKLPEGYFALTVGDELRSSDLYLSSSGKWEDCGNLVGMQVIANGVKFARKI